MNLADDVLPGIGDLRRTRGVGVSEAVNELIRAGLARRSTPKPFRQRTHDMGVGADVTNVWQAIEVGEGPSAT